MNALYDAIRSGSLELVENLIEQGTDLSPEPNRSPLHEAMRLGREQIAKKLVEAGADVNARVGDGYAPLRIALAANDLAMAEFLIDSGADANTATRFGETPLHSVHVPAMAELLIRKGADVNARAMDRGTPLHYAAWWDRIEVVRLLVENGADLDVETVDGRTPLDAAIEATYRVMPVEGTESVRDRLERLGARRATSRPVADSELDPRILRPYLQVYDGIVPSDLKQEAWSRLNSPIWGFGLGTFEGSPYKNARTSISPSDPMVKSMSALIEPKLPYKCRLMSVYANANRTGDADQVHKDGDEPGYPTALYYANPEWQSESAGETVFYNESKDEFVQSVYPRPGRVAIFDGRIWHNVRVPSRHYGGIRVSVVFNYEHTAF